jgi:hypothetical protein
MYYCISKQSLNRPDLITLMRINKCMYKIVCMCEREWRQVLNIGEIDILK